MVPPYSAPRVEDHIVSLPLFSSSPLLHLDGRLFGGMGFSCGPARVPIDPPVDVPIDCPTSSLRRDSPSPFEEGGPSVNRRKKRKQLKRQNNKHLSMGVDLDMDEVIPLAERMLAGKVRSRPWGYNSLFRWMQETWGGHLQHLPQISFLAHGWLGFTTYSKEDVD